MASKSNNHDSKPNLFTLKAFEAARSVFAEVASYETTSDAQIEFFSKLQSVLVKLCDLTATNELAETGSTLLQSFSNSVSNIKLFEDDSERNLDQTICDIMSRLKNAQKAQAEQRITLIAEANKKLQKTFNIRKEALRKAPKDRPDVSGQLSLDQDELKLEAQTEEYKSNTETKIREQVNTVRVALQLLKL